MFSRRVFIALTPYFSLQDVDDVDDLGEDSQPADVTSHPDADTTIIFITGEGQTLSFTRHVTNVTVRAYIITPYVILNENVFCL